MGVKRQEDLAASELLALMDVSVGFYNFSINVSIEERVRRRERVNAEGLSRNSCGKHTICPWLDVRSAKRADSVKWFTRYERVWPDSGP